MDISYILFLKRKTLFTAIKNSHNTMKRQTTQENLVLVGLCDENINTYIHTQTCCVYVTVIVAFRSF
jgi:hypothetical protein